MLDDAMTEEGIKVWHDIFSRLIDAYLQRKQGKKQEVPLDAGIIMFFDKYGVTEENKEEVIDLLVDELLNCACLSEELEKENAKY